jgi:hypothetical protein
MRRQYFTESHNSIHKVVGALDLADTMGAVDGGVANDVQVLRPGSLLARPLCATLSSPRAYLKRWRMRRRSACALQSPNQMCDPQESTRLPNHFWMISG